MAVYHPVRFLHGGDYNPDQWLEYPEVLRRDIELMKEAHVNAVSVGIFSWAFLEPEEGRYEFGWLDEIIDRLTDNGIGIILATPSAARPAWLAQKYPEVLRCGADFERRHFGERHNHCLTSPVYREKVRLMDSALARHYAGHRGILLWHLGNEFGGHCFCPLCAEAFRNWLKEKYGTLEELNRRWWTSFWSQRYTDWSQIEPPSPRGEISNPSMKLDWRRFETRQCASFIAMEREAVHAYMPDVPATANLMEHFRDYDYFAIARELDIVSWDAYPAWRGGDETALAAEFAMQHDLMRSLKKQPFLLMESTPSLVNWKPHNKLKRPGMHLLSSLQAVSHGSQSVLMFQWRKGRGGAEAFHGAVVSHDGRSDTRVFNDVKHVGQVLEGLAPVLEKNVHAKAAILFDYENWWALNEVQAAHPGDMRYDEVVGRFHRCLWERGISVDFINMDVKEIPDDYRLVIVPEAFMFRGGIGDALKAFTARGGTLLVTCFSGVVDGDDLAFMGDAPHGLTDVLGLRAEEVDALYPSESTSVHFSDGTECAAVEILEIPRDVTAETLAVYGEDMVVGMPCVTRNRFGAGTAWYLAARLDQKGLRKVFDLILHETPLPRAVDTALPEGVAAAAREDIVFLQNYSGKIRFLSLPGRYVDLVTGSDESGEIVLPVNGVMVLKPAGEEG